MDGSTMTKTLAIGIAGAIAAIGPTFAQQPMELLYSPTDQFPIWVSTTSAFTPFGPDPTVFSPEVAQSIEQVLRGPEPGGVTAALSFRGLEDECILVFPSLACQIHLNEHRKVTTLDSLMESDLIVLAKVRDTEAGFFHGDLGTLMLVEVASSIKGNTEKQELLLFVPVGAFEYNGKKYCKAENRYAKLPQPGDSAILALDSDWLFQDVVFIPDTRMFTFAKGEMSLPRQIAADEGSISRVLRDILRELPE